MTNCGFSEEEARAIEANYHKLYKVSDEWVQARLEQASMDGYVTCAFGLRVRTPLLAQVILGNCKTPREAEAEGRTAGNALGQSWGLLNSKACFEFMRRVRASKYRTDIQPVGQIHDSIYLRWTDSWEVTKWVNDNLIECMQWQDHPDIQHPTVKLGAELDIFYPTWNDAITLKNDISQDEIKSTVITELHKR